MTRLEQLQKEHERLLKEQQRLAIKFIQELEEIKQGKLKPWK
jgi:hypothetical protein